jgi:acetyl esterase/lipase
MQSLKSRIIHRILKNLNYKDQLWDALNEDDALLGQRASIPRDMKLRFKITKDRVVDRDVFVIKPRIKPSNTVVLYLHGGAYVSNFASIHWRFMSRLIRRTRSTIIAPDYPLAPLASYQETYDMLMHVLRAYREQLKDKNIVFMGDSAGGGLVLGLKQLIKDEFDDLAPKLILISPWLDLSMKLPMIEKIDPHDPILNIQALKRTAKMYAKGTQLKHPMVSPLYGDLTFYENAVLIVGTYDMLYADAKALKERMDAQKITLNLYTYPKMVHVFPLFNMPESRKALHQIIKHMNGKNTE